MRSERATGVVGLLLVGALGVLGCGADSHKEPPKEKTKPNVILIVFDALRADKLGAYGNLEGLTPNLDDFASDSLVYERAYAQSSWTKTSVASILTGLYPYRHRVLEEFSRQGFLPASAITLAERLERESYRTAAFAMNPHISRGSGFDQGFEEFVHERSWLENTAAATSSVIEYLKAADREERQFVYVHYLDPHDPWPRRDMCEPFFAGMTKVNVDEDVLKGLPVNVSGETKIENLGAKAVMPVPDALSEKERKYLELLYDCEIAFIDKAFGRLIGFLENDGWLEDALVIVTSDHGEELLDHGLLRHGYQLYNETVQVPLLVHPPSGVEVDAAATDAVVELVDIAPTIYKLVGTQCEGDLDGVPLPGLGGGDPAKQRSRAFGTTRFRKQDEAYLVDHEDKLIYDFNHQTCELFDLERDPREEDPIACERSQRAQTLLSALKARKRSGERHALKKTEAEPNLGASETLKKELEALGYVQ